MGAELLTALTLGLRHGVDWDHIAAISDLTGSQQRRSRAMLLASCYVLGHAAVVLVLGLVAILFARQVPGWLDEVMGRIVGVTLIALGAYLLVAVVRGRAATAPRSRFLLLLGGVRALLARRRGGDIIVVEHSHEHGHDDPLHEHAHVDDHEHADPVAPLDAPLATSRRHSHRHRHVAVMPADPFSGYGAPSATVVGVLHGIGAETPTQVLVIAAAAQASGRPTSIAILVCFLAGLVCSNTAVALASTFGLTHRDRYPRLTASLTLAAATMSLVLGALLVAA